MFSEVLKIMFFTVVKNVINYLVSRSSNGWKFEAENWQPLLYFIWIGIQFYRQ